MNNAGQVTGIIALIVALIALVLGWMAFNRTGADLESAVRQQVEEATADINANIDANISNFEERMNQAEMERRAAENAATSTN